MDILSKLDHRVLKIAAQAGQLASQLHCRAYLVGGPVRDLILGQENMDVDITVEGNAMFLAESFAKLKGTGKIIKYPAFKTATVSLSKNLMVDFATARKETYVRGGAFPAVIPSNLKDDLFRRDFTINAIAISINPETWGKVIDPFKGREDLRLKKIRILHMKSFIDDPTRIIRAARFSIRLGFQMEQKSLVSLKKAVLDGVLETIKPQRYAKEFNKILKEQKSKEMIQCLKLWKAYRGEK